MKLFSSLLISSSIFNLVQGHGYLKSPRSRNFYAAQEGGFGAGVPPKEFEPQSINRKRSDQVCGSLRQDYDNYRDSRGSPMPWIPQGVYREGQEIDIEFTLTANHWGHIELYVCPDGNDSTQACFERNPAIMVRDLKYNGPRDSTYPQRGYLGSPNLETFRFRYRLPNGVRGDRVMMQWRYVTANSCLPRGYRNNSELVRRGWVKTQLGDCSWPLNWTGQGLPEQFFNCAEIQINGSGGGPRPSPPGPSPTPPRPSPTPPANGTCGGGSRGNGVCPISGECCSEWGWCGTSQDHCRNTPPAPGPSPTPPANGTCGGGSRGNGVCPISGECCSEWGWCGTSQDHCKNGGGGSGGGNSGSGPGTCGNGSRGNGRCPISSECCSQWGWCGTSGAHCN